MNQQQSSSATISSTRSNKRSRGGNTERKDNGISQNPTTSMSSDDNNKCTNVNDETRNSESTHTIISENRTDDAELASSHNGINKRPRSRSTGSSTGNLQQPSTDFAGPCDNADNNVIINNNSSDTTKNSAASILKRKLASQVPQMTEDYVELASHMMLHPLSQIRAATLLASGHSTTATTTATIDGTRKTNGSKQNHEEDHDAIDTTLAMTPQSQYLVHISALGYLKSAMRQPTVIEKWSPYEIAMFEASIAEHGKNFARIQKEIGMTKSVQDVIEFYYIWKKTSHYMHWKKEYIPEYLDVDVDE